MDLQLQSELIYKNNLNTEEFARMLDDPTQCYKFYWLEAILNLMVVDTNDLEFNSIFDEMICEAWYSVTRYHLHLGPTVKGKTENLLEHAVQTVEKDSELPCPATRADILCAIKRQEENLYEDKKRLALYVPYRLISSFLTEIKGNDKLWDQRTRMIAYIEELSKTKQLFYTIIEGRGLHKKIHINKYWRELILDNYPVIISWVQLKKIRYLQDRNPGVPGIIYKLSNDVENARKLTNVRDLWKSVAEIGEFTIHDIYSGASLDMKKYDLDHFIPWSYVANDEIWNLTPMDSKLNSSKSNHLPDWDIYFQNLASIQYSLYTTIFKYENIRKKFEKCRRDNLNAIWASESLYIEGNSKDRFVNVLEQNMKPIYNSAYLQGYDIWRLTE